MGGTCAAHGCIGAEKIHTTRDGAGVSQRQGAVRTGVAIDQDASRQIAVAHCKQRIGVADVDALDRDLDRSTDPVYAARRINVDLARRIPRRGLGSIAITLLYIDGERTAPK